MTVDLGYQTKGTDETWDGFPCGTSVQRRPTGTQPMRAALTERAAARGGTGVARRRRTGGPAIPGVGSQAAPGHEVRAR
jgi:hypothetical protein